MNALAGLLGVLCCLLTFHACDGGLEPPEGTGGPVMLEGTIRYAGGPDAWPPPDSLVSIRVAAFPDEAPASPDEIINRVIGGSAYFTLESLAFNVDSSDFAIEVPEPVPANIAYLAVAQQYGEQIESDWIVLGVYTLSGDPAEPGVVELSPGRRYTNLDIEVDFDNLPPQPF